MTELQANVIGGLIFAACVVYSIIILRAGSKGHWPW